jgi:hypothetical protein
MKPIKLARTPVSAYDPERQVSSLQISQIQLLQEVVREGIKTEGQAAEYIRALNRRVKARFPHATPTAHSAGKKRTQGKRKGKTKSKTKGKTKTGAARRKRSRS